MTASLDAENFVTRTGAAAFCAPLRARWRAGRPPSRGALPNQEAGRVEVLECLGIVSSLKQWLDQRFRIEEQGSSVGRELTAGCTTFLAMAYIAVVNPAILADAGMDFGAVFVATCLAASVGTMLMGLAANYPGWRWRLAWGRTRSLPTPWCWPAARRGRRRSAWCLCPECCSWG